ncbi:hypothetical protein CBER1_10741 [Cercospora berteroae]|uniref:Uncharacterized protein n=1 Tax=Cercospora berteroae TaxID=357750 RepID=A0A2S6BXZ9_9PEZI|nr:hypothetical protein CBER1_10741 [Cercospora berteroae]
MFIQFSPSSLPPQTRRPSAIHQFNHHHAHHSTFVAPSKRHTQDSIAELINFDLSVRLDIFEKCHRLHETARCFQLAEEAGHITRHEAQLIVDFDECYLEGVSLLKYKKILPGANQWLDPPQQQQYGKEIFAELQQYYGRVLFPCIETIVIAAKYLDNMWDDADDEEEGMGWLFADSKFIDIFLLRMHNFMWRTHGPAKHRQTIYNLPLGDVDVFQDGLQDFFERDRDANGLGLNVVKTRHRLKALCGSNFIRFQQWLEVFYRDSDKARTLPTVVEPLAIMESAEAEPDTAVLLETMASHLAPYSQYPLVQMVWRDFIVPAANEGDERELINYGGHFVLMASGEEPRVHPDHVLDAVINYRDQDDDENNATDDNLSMGEWTSVED